jgi:hypothetical protein
VGESTNVHQLERGWLSGPHGEWRWVESKLGQLHPRGGLRLRNTNADEHRHQTEE